MDSAKETSKSVLELFNDDELQVYDVQFLISSPSADNSVGYTLMGARNASGSKEIVWNNYNIEESAE